MEHELLARVYLDSVASCFGWDFLIFLQQWSLRWVCNAVRFEESPVLGYCGLRGGPLLVLPWPGVCVAAGTVPWALPSPLESVGQQQGHSMALPSPLGSRQGRRDCCSYGIMPSWEKLLYLSEASFSSSMKTHGKLKGQLDSHGK